jgi:hypothetical protein
MITTRLTFLLHRAMVAGLLVLPGASAIAGAAQPDRPAELDVTLAMSHGTDGIADGVAITYTYKPAFATAEPLTLALDTLEPALERSTDQVAALTLADDRGALPVGAAVRKQVGPKMLQTWTTTRPASGPVRVSYSMAVAPGKVAKRGPQFDLQAAGGGVSGGYVAILALPDTNTRFATHVHWKLPAGAMAESSYGEGDYKGTFTTDELANTLFLAGPVKSYRPPDQAKDTGLEVYGLGVADQQLQAAGGWAAMAYAAELKAFKLSGRPYRFMIRSFVGGSNASGRAAPHSFMLYVPPGADPNTNKLHYVVAHEMVHSLARFLEKEDVSGDWYTEGLANYVALTVPNAVGGYTPAEYLELVKEESAGYYTNAKRALPNSALPDVVWSGRNAWLLPYNRGTLYLADLDAKLKIHDSKVTVLDLANEMSQRIDAGEPSDRQTWLDVLSKRAGPWAVSDWSAMMAGTIIYPVQGAFGSCMHAAPQDVRIFDLGFATPVRLMAGATIGGVAKGSAADRAGLRDGDVLAGSVDINPAASSVDLPVTLRVLRAGVPVTVTYQPAGGSQPGMVWHSTCVAIRPARVA